MRIFIVSPPDFSNQPLGDGSTAIYGFLFLRTTIDIKKKLFFYAVAKKRSKASLIGEDDMKILCLALSN
jgi:hypothetical protein